MHVKTLRHIYCIFLELITRLAIVTTSSPWARSFSVSSGGTLDTLVMLNLIVSSWSRAEPSANLTEGNTYYIEILRFQPKGEEGHFHLKATGPGYNRSISVPREHLVAYQQSKLNVRQVSVFLSRKSNYKRNRVLCCECSEKIRGPKLIRSFFIPELSSFTHDWGGESEGLGREC